MDRAVLHEIREEDRRAVGTEATGSPKLSEGACALDVLPTTSGNWCAKL
jgi:hypothetical protein